MVKSQIWGGVFDSSPSDIMKQINSSIGFDKELYKQDIRGSIVHAEMLAKQGIITNDDFDQIKRGLESIEVNIDDGKFVFKEELEDIHMNIEAELTNRVGEPGKKLHTARSRNDQVATDLKIYIIEAAESLQLCIKDLLQALLVKAEENQEHIMPSFTHLQVAQPILLSHWLLAYCQMFLRDLRRFQDFTEKTKEECPLGSCALGGTSYPIDRDFTAKGLGFNRPTINSLDSVSDRDFALEFLFFCSTVSMHLSRLCEELVIFVTSQFAFVKLSDEFTTGSSIMPQKRNPDGAELVRAKTGSVYGNLMGLLTVMKGLPLAYSKDMQEDKEFVFNSYKTTAMCLKVCAGMVSDISFNHEQLRLAAESGYSTATDFADHLVQKYGLSFREAHHVSGKLVKHCIQLGKKLTDLTLEELCHISQISLKEDILDIIKPDVSARAKTSYGGSSVKSIRSQIELVRLKLSTI